MLVYFMKWKQIGNYKNVNTKKITFQHVVKHFLQHEHMKRKLINYSLFLIVL